MAQISSLTGARWLFEASHSYISRARYSIARLIGEELVIISICLCSVCDGFTRTDSFVVNRDATRISQRRALGFKKAAVRIPFRIRYIRQL
jgi:hypothetical protein